MTRDIFDSPEYDIKTVAMCEKAEAIAGSLNQENMNISAQKQYNAAASLIRGRQQQVFHAFAVKRKYYTDLTEIYRKIVADTRELFACSEEIYLSDWLLGTRKYRNAYFAYQKAKNGLRELSSTLGVVDANELPKYPSDLRFGVCARSTFDKLRKYFYRSNLQKIYHFFGFRSS